MEACGVETHCSLTSLMGAPLPGVTLGPVSGGIEGRDADQVLGVTSQVLQLHHRLRQEKDLHLLCFVLALCLPVVNLLERARSWRQVVEEWLPLFLSLWETEEARVQGDLGPWAEHASPWVGYAVAWRAESRGGGAGAEVNARGRGTLGC